MDRCRHYRARISDVESYVEAPGEIKLYFIIIDRYIYILEEIRQVYRDICPEQETICLCNVDQEERPLAFFFFFFETQTYINA